MTNDNDRCRWDLLPKIPKATLPPDPDALPPGVIVEPHFYHPGYFPKLPSDYWREYREAQEAARKASLYPGRGIWKDKGDLIAVIDDAHGKIVDAIWDAVASVLRPPLRFVARCLPPILMFVFVYWLIHNFWIAVLMACGIGPFDLLRSAGIIGPKKRDKDGKEIDDPF